MPEKPTIHGFVLDYAYGRPSPAWMARSGVAGVLRYLCDTPDKPGKKLTTDELDDLLAAGLAVGACWQEKHDSITGAADTGAEEAERARKAMEALGAPEGAAVYFAADSEKVTAAHAVEYLKAAQDALGGYKLGLYGGVEVIEGVAKEIEGVYLWQTAAWSGDRIADGVHLYQGLHRGNFGGEQVDANTAFAADWGQFTQRT